MSRSGRLALAGVLLVAGTLVAAFVAYRLRAPAGAPEAPPPELKLLARFELLEGSVDAKSVDTLEWSAAKPDAFLRRQDMVRTGRDGTAGIRFFEGAELDLRPDSLITIEEGSRRSPEGRPQVAWRISQGAASFKTATRTLTVISTPQGTARTSDAADVAIEVGSDGEVQLRVFEGSSELVTEGSRSVRLAAGEAVKVDAGGAVGPRQRLLPAPPLRSPPAQALVSYPDPSRKATEFAWEAIPGAVAYRLVLGRSPSFAEAELDRAGLDAASLTVRTLQRGTYHWRVAGIGSDGVEGRFSEARLLQVADSGGQGYGPAPPLSITSIELKDGLLRVAGVTEPDAKVEIGGAGVGVGPDGAFQEFFVAQAMGSEVVVVSTSINGGVREVSARPRGSAPKR